MNFLKQNYKTVNILTLVGRGAKYSGVMYLSPTLEIMVVIELRSLFDVDVDDVEICSRIVMGSRFQEANSQFTLFTNADSVAAFAL